MDFCAGYFIQTLKALSLSSEEVLSYKSLNKLVFPVTLNYKGGSFTFYLRKQKSIHVINTLTSQWKFYTRLFTVKSHKNEVEGKSEERILEFDKFQQNNGEGKIISFLTSGQHAATFSWFEKRTLFQIEQMTGFTVNPRGVISQFKHGGFVVYEKDGHGLVVTATDLRSIFDWNTARKTCVELILNGYNDWHLPTSDELNEVFKSLKYYGVGGFSDVYYWSSTEKDVSNAWAQNLNNGKNYGFFFKLDKYYFRAVRSF